MSARKDHLSRPLPGDPEDPPERGDAVSLLVEAIGGPWTQLVIHGRFPLILPASVPVVSEGDYLLIDGRYRWTPS